MTETTTDLHESESSAQNEALLKSGEYGEVLSTVYHTAVGLDPRLGDVEVKELQGNGPRIAFSRPSWSPESTSGRHEVHVRLHDLQPTFDNIEKLPVYRQLIATRLAIPVEACTPKIMYVFGLAHELGHAVDYADHADDAEAFQARNQYEMSTLPIGGATPVQLLDPESSARKVVEQNWEGIAAKYRVSSLEELVDLQARFYKDNTSERAADGFAADIFRANPGLLAELSA